MMKWQLKDFLEFNPKESIKKELLQKNSNGTVKSILQRYL